MYMDMQGVITNDGASLLGNHGQGAIGQRLEEVRFDPGLLRPFIDDSGEKCVMVQNGMKYDTKAGVYIPNDVKCRVSDLQRRGINSPVFNAMTLTKQAWIDLDRAMVKARRNRLRAWTDLAAMNSITVPGMTKMTHEYQNMSDPGEAVVDMDGMTFGRRDRPKTELLSVPLPITHSDFYFSEREIGVSRNTGMPLDTTMVEACTRRVAEMVERTVIGTVTGVTYGTRSGDASVAHTGTSTVYGYTNYPYRITKTDLTTPTGTNPEAVMTDVLEMIETMQTNGYYGPYMLYHSTPYSRYLNDDYFRTGSTSAVRLLRERLLAIEGIADIRRLDYLTSGYQLILVAMDAEVAQAINGMDMTVLHWESLGGAQQNFRVMCIHVPLLKTPQSGIAGVLHATTS